MITREEILDGEEWRTITEHPLYDVSNMGRVRSWNWQGKRAPRPRVLIPQRTNVYGHRQIVFGCGSAKDIKREYVHKLVLQEFVGKRPDGLECCHNNGDPTDNRLSNIRWDTHRNNALDSKRHGSFPLGENNGKSKLKDKDAIDIKYYLWCGTDAKYLAKMYGVSRCTIYSIKNETSRRHLWNQ